LIVGNPTIGSINGESSYMPDRDEQKAEHDYHTMQNQDEIADPLPCYFARRAHKGNTQDERQQADSSTPGTFRKHKLRPSLKNEVGESDQFASAEQEQLHPAPELQPADG
jgi:hypothetical protein